MKKFVIQGASFTGCMYIEYDATGRLITADVSHAELNDEQRFRFFRQAPVFISELDEFATKTKLKILEQIGEISYDDFYIKYNFPKGRKRGLAKWIKMKEADHIRAYLYVDTYDNDLKITPRNKMYVETYLNAEPWND